MAKIILPKTDKNPYLIADWIEQTYKEVSVTQVKKLSESFEIHINTSEHLAESIKSLLAND